MSARAPRIHLDNWRPESHPEEAARIKEAADRMRPRFEQEMRAFSWSVIERERDDRNAAKHDAIYAHNRAFCLGLAQSPRSPRLVQETADSAEPVQHGWCIFDDTNELELTSAQAEAPPADSEVSERPTELCTQSVTQTPEAPPPGFVTLKEYSVANGIGPGVGWRHMRHLCVWARGPSNQLTLYIDPRTPVLARTGRGKIEL